MKRIQRFIFGSELTLGQKLMVMAYFFSYGLIILTENCSIEQLEYGYMHFLLKVSYAIAYLTILFPLYCIPLLSVFYRWARRRDQWVLFYALPWALHVIFVINICFQLNLETSLLIPKGADPATVEVLWGNYIKDKDHVWYKCKEMPYAEASSFRNLGHGYACDDKQAYYLTYIIEGADPKSIVAVGKYLAKDKDDCYVAGNKVHAADPKSFKVFSSEYHPNADAGIWCIDKENIYYLQDFLWEEFTIKTIKTEDYEGFHVLKEERYYAADKHHVYGGGTILEGADPETFHVVDRGSIIGQDKHRVYFAEYPRDLKEYSLDRWISNNPFYLDGNTVLDRTLLPMPAGTDPQTIHTIGYRSYSADCRHVYWERTVVEGADPNLFTPVSVSCIQGKSTYPRYTRYYGKDDQHVFFKDSLMEEADAASFRALEDDSTGISVVFDKNRIYEGQMTDAIQEYLSISQTSAQ